jgi:hypothetical protein
MNKLIKNQNDLASWIRSEPGRLDLAVAFWGSGAIEGLSLRRDRKIRILLELQSGGTNPSVVEELVRLFPAGVRSVERLHAKAYIGENKLAIGSTNASADGLGLEGAEATQWFELMLETRDRTAIAEAQHWFDDLWRCAETVDPAGDRFNEAKLVWKARRKTRPPQTSAGQSLLAAALGNPDAFRNKGRYVVIDTVREFSKAGARALAEKTKELGHQAYAWESWLEIPEQALFVCFYKDAGGFNWADDGAPEPVFRSGDRSLGRMQFVTPTHVPGFKHNIGTLNEWIPLLKNAARANPGMKRQGGMHMDLGEFVATYGVALGRK